MRREAEEEENNGGDGRKKVVSMSSMIIVAEDREIVAESFSLSGLPLYSLSVARSWFRKQQTLRFNLSSCPSSLTLLGMSSSLKLSSISKREKSGDTDQKDSL